MGTKQNTVGLSGEPHIILPTQNLEREMRLELDRGDVSVRHCTAHTWDPRGGRQTAETGPEADGRWAAGQ